jgi:hypothetical protein
MKQVWDQGFHEWRAIRDSANNATPEMFHLIWDQVSHSIETQIDWQIKRNLLNLE